MKSKLFAVLAALVVLFIASPAAFAQDAGAAAEGAGWILVPLVPVLPSVLLLSVLHSVKAVRVLLHSKASPATLQAAGKIQTPMIIALAFTEALALYGFVIGIMIVGKI